MYRTLKNRLKGRRKIKDAYGATSCQRPNSYLLGHSQTYYRSLTHFLEVLRRGDKDLNSVRWRETIGWEPQIKFSWYKPQIFSPQEAADYIEKRHLLSDVWNYFESRWQIFSSKSHTQNYFDIDIYHTTFPIGSLEVGKLKHRITLDYLVTQES